jgi:hypothetical protein
MDKVAIKVKTAAPKTEKTKTEKQVKKTSLHVKSGGSSIIYRGDNLPFICDKTDNAVKWLHDNGYKEEEIEIVGEKPEVWDSIFSPSQPVIAPEPAAEPVETPIAPISAPANPEAFVDKIINTASSPSQQPRPQGAWLKQ